MPDFLNIPDSEFHAFQNHFLNVAIEESPELGLPAEDLTPLSHLQSTWAGAYNGHVAAQAAAQAATQAKDAARAAYQAAIRELVARLQASPTVTDAQRAALGIPIRSKDRTPAAVPTTRPVLQVDTSQRLCHVVSFTDESTPGSRAKPKGVMGCEIWVKIGDAPPNDCNDCAFLSLDTASPYLAEYPGAKKNQVAHYMARWVNTRGAKGPWSETVSATIGA